MNRFSVVFLLVLLPLFNEKQNTTQQTDHTKALHGVASSVVRKKMGQSFGAEFRAAHPEEIGPDGKVRVCVGGGAGFIGSHIAKRLKEDVSHVCDCPQKLLMFELGMLRHCC